MKRQAKEKLAPDTVTIFYYVACILSQNNTTYIGYKIFILRNVSGSAVADR